MIPAKSACADVRYGSVATLEGGSGMSALSPEADMLIFDIDVR
jgi:hypothetical protein